MALSNAIMKYVGNELAQSGQKSLTKAATGAATSGLLSALTQAAPQTAAKSVVNSIIPVTLKNGSIAPNAVKSVGSYSEKPKIVYHGSPTTGIEEFDLNMAGKNTQSGERAIYFTDDYPTAEEFSYERLPSNSMFENKRGKKGEVYTRKLNLKNQLDLDNLTDEQISALYDYIDPRIKQLTSKDKFTQTLQEARKAKNGQMVKAQLDLNKLANSDYDGFVASMYPGQNNVKEYGVFDTGAISKIPGKHIPINQISGSEDVPVSTLKQLFRGQIYTDKDFSFNSPSMNSGESSGSQALGHAYHFTPDANAAKAWADNNGGGVIKIGYTPDQLLRADDARRMINESSELLSNDKYMQELWKNNPELAEQTELIGIGNLEALAKRENKPFVEHLAQNDDELGTIYYYKDIDPELTDKFIKDFQNSNAEKYLSAPKERGLTSQQQEYFKNSKLRDDQGNLIKVYHSTPEDFAKFDDKKLGANTGYENTAYGHFVTPDREFSELGSFNKEGVPTTIKEMYANVQNPIVHPSNAGLKYSGEDLDNVVKNWFEAIDDPYTLAEITDAAQANGTSLYDEYENLFDLGSESPYINAGDERKALMEKGYDAVEMVEGLKRDLIHRGEDASPVSSYAIFNSSQLKDINNRMPIASPFQSGEYDQNQTIRRIFSDDSYKRLRESPVIDQLGPLQLEAYKAAQEGSLFGEDFLKNDPFYTDLQDKMTAANKNKFITHDMEDNPDLIPAEKLQQLQNISKDFIRENIKGVGQDRKAVIVVGRPSSGKSSGAVNQYSVRKKTENGGDFFELDNDEIKKLIPGYENGIGASAVQEASSLVGKKMVLPELAEGGYNIVLPIVGQKEKSVMNYVDTLANAGYEIALVNTTLPVDSCRTRNRTRSYETGRGVPDDYIVSVGNKPDEVYNKIVNDIKNGKERRISSYAAVSTDVDFGAPARVIENSGSELLARLNN